MFSKLSGDSDTALSLENPCYQQRGHQRFLARATQLCVLQRMCWHPHGVVHRPKLEAKGPLSGLLE